MVVAEPPYAFRGGTLAALAHSLGRNLGAHGYDPRYPDMAGILFALGRGVAPGGDLGEVSALDVAPSVAQLLGMEAPRHAEGRPIPSLGGRLAGP